MDITPEQMRAAALRVLAGEAPRHPGIEYDNFTNLKIGVRAMLAESGLLDPQIMGGYPADSALTLPQANTLATIYDDLRKQGVISQHHNSDRFNVSLLPLPFAKKWRYVGELRGGGQGETKEVIAVADGTPGVLKTLKTQTEAAVQRFLREVAVVLATSHPAIVRLLEVNTDTQAGPLGYVTPLGVPLNAYWGQKVPTLSATQRYDAAYEILRQMCDGLQMLHAQGIVHRDLKPENVVMIGEQPVIIDFGVAHREGEERLSDLDGRIVANRFATPAPAHYGLMDPVPAWDCLGLGWIYGYLVGEGKRPKQFHWRHHILVAEYRQRRARALLAACSHEDTCPTDAATFTALMDRFKLGRVADELPLTCDEEELRGVAKAHAEAEAAAKIVAMEELERVEVAAAMIEPTLSEFRDRLVKSCDFKGELPVHLYDALVRAGGSFVSVAAPNRPMAGLIKHVYSSKSEPLFWCTCRPDRDPFSLHVFLNFGVQFVGVPAMYSISMVIGLKDRGFTEPIEKRFWFTKKGELTDSPGGPGVPVQEVAELARKLIITSSHWQKPLH